MQQRSVDELHVSPRAQSRNPVRITGCCADGTGQVGGNEVRCAESAVGAAAVNASVMRTRQASPEERARHGSCAALFPRRAVDKR